MLISVFAACGMRANREEIFCDICLNSSFKGLKISFINTKKAKVESYKDNIDCCKCMVIYITLKLFKIQPQTFRAN